MGSIIVQIIEDEACSMSSNATVTCMSIEEVTRIYFFASGATIIVLLFLVLMLLLVILCMRVKISRIMKRCAHMVSSEEMLDCTENAVQLQDMRELVDTSQNGALVAAEGDGTTVADSGTKLVEHGQSGGMCNGGKEALHHLPATLSATKLALSSPVEEKPSGAETAATPNAVDKSYVPDYETIEGATTLAQLSSKPNLHDYSSIDDILSILPRETADRNLNVIIVTNNAAGFSAPEASKSDNKEDGNSNEQKNAVPVYSVVNKKRRKESETDYATTSGFTVTDEIGSTKGASHDSDSNKPQEPPPPIPPRTYETNKVENEDLGTMEADEEALDETGLSHDEHTEPNCTVERGIFAIQSSSNTRRRSYETVDLITPKLTVEEDASQPSFVLSEATQ